MTTMINTDVLVMLDELQNRYIAALDGKNMQAWSDCFSTRADASYICRSAENEAMNYPIALMYDDCRARIEDRITFVDDIWRGTFQDYRNSSFHSENFPSPGCGFRLRGDEQLFDRIHS